MTQPPRTRRPRPAQYCGIASPIHAPHTYRGHHDGRSRLLICPGARWANRP